MISYLPLAHSFEKVLFTAALLVGVSIGYYSGDPLKLLDDLAELKPHFFPSVPRLFNRIYDKI
jgi:long-chain acyl-CoA synthetase